MDALIDKFPDYVITSEEVNGEVHAVVTGTDLIPVCKFLKDEQGFDYPADLCAWDTGEEIKVWYRLYSMSANATVILKVHLLRDRAAVPSVTTIWPGMRQVVCLPLITLAGLLSAKPTIEGNDIAE